jgi:hypothetical protein
MLHGKPKASLQIALHDVESTFDAWVIQHSQVALFFTTLTRFW